MRRIPRARAAVAPFFVLAAAASAATACSVLLDWDLSGAGAGTQRDGGADAGATTDGATLADGALPTDARDDRATATVLDCTGALLCDDFENRTDPKGAPRIGAWNNPQFDFGDASVDTSIFAAGARSLLVAVPLSGPTRQHSFLGATSLQFGAALTFSASFDILLEYDPAAYSSDASAGEYHVMVEFGPSATPETIGIYYARPRGVYLVATAYDASGSPITDVSMPLASDLRGGFHHVVLEGVFSTSTAVGTASVVVDKSAKTALGKFRTLKGALPTHFDATFGASAGPTTPSMKAHYDNIVVTTR